MLSERNFTEVCEGFLRGTGRGIEYAVCLFPNDIDIESERFEGVEFSLHSGEEVIVDYAVFCHYLGLVCNRYILSNGDSRGTVALLLDKIRQKYNC